MMQGHKTSFPLLSLPELPFNAVIKCLSSKDKLSLAATCWSLAVSVSAAAQCPSLNVTSQTGWKGLSKVSCRNTITCKAMVLRGRVSSSDQLNEDGALDVLLKSTRVLGCSFKGISNVTLDAHPLPCLLPGNLARTLPDLGKLVVQCHPEQYAEIQPLPYCSSLHDLSYMNPSGPLQLPTSHHTVEDLKRQLPSITALKLVFSKGYKTPIDASLTCVDTMLEAWGKKLTELDLTVATTKLQTCTQLRTLTWHARPHYMTPLSPFPLSLTSLHLGFDLREPDLKSILQLPALCVLDICGFEDRLQQDWSKHSCTWKQLVVDKLNMVDLSKLPLHSLSGRGCLKAKYVELPHPLLPNSLADVAYTAQCLSNAGMAVECVQEWTCTAWDVLSEGDDVDIASVELVNAASRVVHSWPDLIRFTRHEMSDNTETAIAIIKWASHNMQRLVIRTDNDPSPWFWETLQCCSKLDAVMMLTGWDFQKRTDHESNPIIEQVQLAAELFVAVTHKLMVLVIEFGISDTPEGDQHAFLLLHSKLKGSLPSSVNMSHCVYNDNTLAIGLCPVG